MAETCRRFTIRL